MTTDTMTRSIQEIDNTASFSISNLTKRFPGFALGPINLEQEPGSVQALVGPNGSGKTTLLNCIIGLTQPNTGSVRILGYPCLPNSTDWKQHIGYVGEKQGFFQNWSAKANLNFIAGFYPSWNADRVTRLARQLALPLDKPVRALSKGNRGKLALLAALGHSPRLLLLDEPFSGFDPLIRDEVHEILWTYLEDGTASILYSTHILSDISRLADTLTFINNGQLIQSSSKDVLIDNWRRISCSSNSDLCSIPCVSQTTSDVVGYRLISYKYEATLAHLTTIGANNIEVTRMGLDEIVVEIMKGQSDVANT